MRDEPAKASGDEPAWSGFDGSPEDRIRQLELENDILRGVVEVLKAARPRALTNGEKTLVIEHLRQIHTDHSLRELTDSLRISKSSYEYQRASIARGDKYGRDRGGESSRYSRPPTVRGATATSPAGSATGRIPSSCPRRS